jgi:hypothetical protein
MSRPLALTDTQLDIVFRLAAPLLEVDRAGFLEDVARALSGLPESATALSRGHAWRSNANTGIRLFLSACQAGGTATNRTLRKARGDHIEVARCTERRSCSRRGSGLRSTCSGMPITV